MVDNLEVTPDVHEMLAFLREHNHQLSEWEDTFVDNMMYWLKVRQREPTLAQRMLLASIYQRVRRKG